MENLLAILETIPDHRADKGKLHNLAEIIVMSLYGLLCGAVTWLDIQEICEAREAELKNFLALKNGVPSVCTFRRVMSKINSKYLISLLNKMADSHCPDLKGKIIALDGKTVRGSQDRINGRDAIHCLNAFVTEHHTVIRQIIGENKESEITMLPEVIDSIDMKGATVTIDAMGCQTKIVKSIRKKKADYMIALKLNQPRAFQEVVELFEYIAKNNIKDGVDVWRQHDKGHGRVEDRSVIGIDLTVYPLEALKKFSGIKSVARVNSVVWRNGEQTQEERYYITSQSLNARKHGETIRAHWAIENKLHYVLDVVFDEDANRSRKEHLAKNFTTLRKVCMNLLRSVKADKKTLKSTARNALMFPEFAFDLIRKSGILEVGTLA